MQLTHDYNYRDFASYIGDPEVFTPNEYATQYVANNYPFLSAAWFWCISKDLNGTIDDYNNRSADATVKEVNYFCISVWSDIYSSRMHGYINC